MKKIERFSEDMSFIDKQGNVVHPNRDEYYAKKESGKAYAFFNCSASIEAIEEELPLIRECVRTPSNLELALMEGTDNLKGDPKLLQIAREAKKAGIRYVFDATYQGGTNRQTADELAGILNQAYQSPLYQEGEQFSGEIVFREKGKYLFRE